MEAIVAVSKNSIIGIDNQLPWSIPEDLAHFRNHTQDSILVMGRKTFESMPKKLEGRIYCILSSRCKRRAQGPDENGHYWCNSFENLEDVLKTIKLYENIEKIFIIGGESVFKELLCKCKRIYYTYVDESYGENIPLYRIASFPTNIIVDCFKLEDESRWMKSIGKDSVQYKFMTYVAKYR